MKYADSTREKISFILKIKVFILGLIFRENGYAKCLYDAELGSYRDDQSILMGVSFSLILVLYAYPLKSWAIDHPAIAVILIFLGPVLLGILASDTC